MGDDREARHGHRVPRPSAWATTVEDAARPRRDPLGHSSTRFDLDIGVMAVASFGRLGLTVRNLTAPGFDTGRRPRSCSSRRQARAGRVGSALTGVEAGWRHRSDENRRHFRGIRELAFGTEGQVIRQLTVRAGLRFNTDGRPATRTPAYSAGVAMRSSAPCSSTANHRRGQITSFAAGG